MAMDVWAVKTEYSHLKRPAPPIYDFLYDLMLNPCTGQGDDPWDNDTWGGSWDNTGLYEFSRPVLRRRALNWANAHNLSQAEKAKLRRWIRSLPWNDEHITLHFGN